MTTQPISDTRKAVLQRAAELFSNINPDSFDAAAQVIEALLTQREQLQLWAYYGAPASHSLALIMDKQKYCNHPESAWQPHPEHPTLETTRCPVCNKYNCRVKTSPDTLNL
jgi:hypothetical protein